MAGRNLPKFLSETFTIRRSAFAVLVFFITLVVAGGVVGFAAAASEPTMPDAPDALQVREPLVGDKGTYALFHYQKEGNKLTPSGPGTSILVFRLDPMTTLLDKDGEPRRVVPITYAALSALSGQPVSGSQGPVNHLGDIDYYDFSADETVGHAYLNKFEQQVDGTATEFAANNTVLTRGKFWSATYDLPGCGLRNIFQGQAVLLQNPVELFEACYFQTGTGQGGYDAIDEPRFRFSGTSQLQGREQFVFSTVQQGQRIEAWFDPALPYPSMFVFSKEDGQSADVISLTDFEGGHSLTRSILPPSTPPAPELVWSARQPWGPSDNAVPHPFPLSAAWDHVLNDADGGNVRQFLSAHPEVTVHEASYYLGRQGRGEMRQWTLRLADSQSSLGVAVLAQTGATGPTVPDPICVGCIEPTELAGGTQYSIRTFDSQSLTGGKPANFDVADLPVRMPTVSSLLARWAAYATNANGEFEWWFSYRCGDDPCTKPSLVISAGASNLTSTGVVPGLTGGNLIMSRDELQFDFDETPSSPRGVYHVTWEASQPGYGILQAGEPASAERAQSMQTRGTVFWSVPTGSLAAGAGVMAAMAGILYWIWPAIRALGLGLFTRLERPKILDHPVRRQIVDMIESNPGIHFAEIVRRVGAGNGNTEHHLRHLVAQKILGEVAAKGYTCYYVPGALGADAARALPAVKSRGARAILSTIARRPGIRAQEVARAIGMSEPTVHYHLVRLREVGLVDAKRGASGLELRATSTAAIVLPIAA